MRHLSLVLSILSMLAGGVVHAKGAESSDPMEQEVAAIVAGEHITVVHFWAPWCSNCEAEMRPEGWPKFIRENPSVKVVFVAVWHEGQNATRKLKAAGLESQENFIALTHSNPSNSRGKKLERFLGLPLQWVPSTWVYRDGKMRYALNYGEVRFEMLQQMIRDADELY